ncbi:unnamed protein product [Absidia cylindrospora]
MSNIRMLDKNEEADTEIEVSWADQQQINAFSKLNAQSTILKNNMPSSSLSVYASSTTIYIEKSLTLSLLFRPQQEKEYLDDVAMELELADEDEPVRHKIGDTFVHIPVSEAVERVEKDSSKLGLELEDIESQINSTQDKMTELKKSLYTKFGNAINLEKD